MPPEVPLLPEVYSAREIAAAAGVPVRVVRELLAARVVTPVDPRFVSQAEAVRAVRLLTGQASAGERTMFLPAAGVDRRGALPVAAAGLLHVAVAAGVLLIATLVTARPQAIPRLDHVDAMHLIFTAIPGPGGGGGGGGLKEPAPPPPARKKGVSHFRSPLPDRQPPPPVVPPPVVRETPVKAEPLPPIVAPVIPVAADPEDKPGLPVTAPPAPDSRGPGTDGGTGTGRGTGIGEGEGPGLGAGSGGGTGGGPYRPGSGITPPAIVREVKPDYTEEGRRRNLEGDVVLEIVVRRDGTVGDVKLLQGLGAGLDQRAIDAVRQWRFSPAHRLGAAVDVIVEVAMEFKLR